MWQLPLPMEDGNTYGSDLGHLWILRYFNLVIQEELHNNRPETCGLERYLRLARSQYIWQEHVRQLGHIGTIYSTLNYRNTLAYGRCFCASATSMGHGSLKEIYPVNCGSIGCAKWWRRCCAWCADWWRLLGWTMKAKSDGIWESKYLAKTVVLQNYKKVNHVTTTIFPKKYLQPHHLKILPVPRPSPLHQLSQGRRLVLPKTMNCRNCPAHEAYGLNETLTDCTVDYFAYMFLGFENDAFAKDRC